MTAPSTQETRQEERQQTTALATTHAGDDETGSIAAFASRGNFEAAQRMAKALASSTIVPSSYQGERGLGNCLVAMEIASRTRASVLMVMQNLYVIEGKPSWSSTFLIGSVNTCGRFSAIRYDTKGGDDATKPDYACRAYATELATGHVLYGAWITWALVKGEGWFQRKGSKWATPLCAQMFMYRAAAFWTRVYAPEIALGMHTADEIEDIGDTRLVPTPGARDLNAALRVVEAVAPAPSQRDNQQQQREPGEEDSLAEDAELVRREGGRLL